MGQRRRGGLVIDGLPSFFKTLNFFEQIVDTIEEISAIPHILRTYAHLAPLT